MLNLINLVRKVTKAVQEKNVADPEVKTADSSIFDKLNERMEAEQPSQNNDSHVDMFERMKKHVDEVQYDNECDVECETAEPSVFADLQREIGILRQKVDAQEANDFTGQQSDSWTPQSSGTKESYAPTRNSGVTQAMTNSMGGSLGLSIAPEIGGASFSDRIPDRSVVTIIKFSENMANLDNKDSRFAFVDFNGKQGWIPEVYLNFN